MLASLPILLLLAPLCASTQAQIYKCREASGAILYTDDPCANDGWTIAVMPKGTTVFQPRYKTNELIEEDLSLLSAHERELTQQLGRVQAGSGSSPQEMAEAYALKMQIQAQLESARRQKTELLTRGVSVEEGEELADDGSEPPAIP
jgi:hypothetical protein